jgi:hypothetical protein
MNKREYLRSLGFKVGERGRFTDEMKIKLAMYDGVFDEDRIDLKLDNLSKFGGKNKQKSNPKNQEQSRSREARTLFGFTREGTKVGFVNCANCHEHMVFCNCSEGVHSPSIVTHSKDTLVFIPKV